MKTILGITLAGVGILLMPAIGAGQSHIEDELRGIRRAIEQQAYEARQREYAEERRRSLEQMNAGLAGLFLALEHRSRTHQPTAPPVAAEPDPQPPVAEPDEKEQKDCPPWWRRPLWVRCG